MLDGIVDRLDDLADAGEAAAVEGLELQERDVPIDAGHAVAVVPLRREDAGHVRAVAVVVERVVVVGDEVPAEEVVGVGRVAVLRAAAVPAALRQRPEQVAGSMRPSPLLSQTRPLFTGLLRSAKVMTPGVAVLICDLWTITL